MAVAMFDGTVRETTACPMCGSAEFYSPGHVRATADGYACACDRQLSGAWPARPFACDDCGRVMCPGCLRIEEAA